jgi:hypothetical protein
MEILEKSKIPDDITMLLIEKVTKWYRYYF